MVETPNPRRLRRRIALFGILAATITAAATVYAGNVMEEPMPGIVEIRSYNLKAGTRSEFHRLFEEEALPLLRKWGIDVVAYGPSPHDETSYYLIRAYEDVEDMNRREEEFYGSDEWRSGPREAILERIENYVTIVLELDAATIDALRRANVAAAPTS